MKPFRFVLLSCAVAFTPLAVPAAVDPAIIPADARWVVFADFNALRGTAPGKEVIALLQKAQHENGNPIGIDIEKVLTTVGAVTAYGSNFSPQPEQLDGTLVLQGTPDLRKIAESLLLQQTIAAPDRVAESKDLPFASYVMTAKSPDGTVKAGNTVIVAFPPEPIILVSKSRAQIVRAHEAFRGAVPSIAKTTTAPLRNLIGASRNAYLYAASMVPADVTFPENQPQARILKMTNSGSIAIGEDGPNTFAHARLLATSDDMADKLMKILQGLTAMLSLAESNDKQLAEFLNSAAVAREDKTVTLNLAYSTDRLAQMIRSLEESHVRRTPEETAAARAAQMTSGEVLSQWSAVAAEPAADNAPAALTWHTVENVALKNGTILTLGRQSNGGKPVRFDRVEITPASGGSALIFRSDFMRTTGRGNMQMFQFPGEDGTYTIKIAYTNDPAGKATYALSARAPRVDRAGK